MAFGNFVLSLQVMLDTVGPELQVVNKTEHPISLQADSLVTLTPDQDKEATSNLLPINFTGLSKVIINYSSVFIIPYCCQLYHSTFD